MGYEKYLLLSKDYASFSILKEYTERNEIMKDIKRLVSNVMIKDNFLVISIAEQRYYSLGDFIGKRGNTND